MLGHVHPNVRINNFRVKGNLQEKEQLIDLLKRIGIGAQDLQYNTRIPLG